MSETLSLTSQGVSTPEGDREAIIQSVCHLIAEKGHSMRSACAKIGLNRITVERWIADKEEWTCAVERARAEFREQLVERALACATKWGSPDPNVTTFLLERTQREDFGQQSEVKHSHEVTVPAAYLDLLARQASALETMAENGHKPALKCPVPATDAQFRVIDVSPSE